MKNLFFLLAISFIGAPFSIFAQDFEIYVSDAGNFNNPPWQILKFDQNGQNGEVFISENLAWPQDIVFLENKNEVLISNLNTGRITRYNSETGAYMSNFATGLGGPTRMKIGDDDLLYVLQWTGDGLVKRYSLEGDSEGSFTSVGVGTSIGMDWDNEGNLWVSSYNGRFIQKFSPTGEDLGKIITSNLAGPTNIWFDDNDDLIVIDYNGGNVKKFDKEGNYLGIFITNLNNGEGIDFLDNGDLIIGEGNSSSVKQFTSEGVFVKSFIASGTINLKTPNAVIIRKTGPVSTYEGALDKQFVTPTLGDMFSISISNSTMELTSISVFDSLGQLVHSDKSSTISTWDASKFPNGTYFMVASFDKGMQWKQKIVVSH